MGLHDGHTRTLTREKPNQCSCVNSKIQYFSPRRQAFISQTALHFTRDSKPCKSYCWYTCTMLNICIKYTILMQQVCNIYSARTKLEWCTTKVLKIFNMHNNFFTRLPPTPPPPTPHIILAIESSDQSTSTKEDMLQTGLPCESCNYQQTNKQFMAKETQLLALILSVYHIFCT